MAAINHPLGRDRRTAAPGERRSVRGLRVNWLVLAACMLIGATAMLPVVQTSTATTTGFGIESLQAERARLQSEIAVLESETAELRSLDRIEARAVEIGLVQADAPHYVTIGEAGPTPAKLPARYLPEPIVEPNISDPWWVTLFNILPFVPG